MNNNTNEMSQNFGQWLLDTRKAKGFTQEQLASKAGLSKSYIGHLENQRPHTTTGAIPQPDRKKVVKIALALGVDENEALNAAGYASLTQSPPEQQQIIEALGHSKNLTPKDFETIKNMIEFLDSQPKE